MQTFVYLILGCDSSGRREILYDLLKDLASADDTFTLLTPAGESPSEWDGKLASIPHTTHETYPGQVDSITKDQMNPQDTILILSPGRANPVDQVEAMKPLLEKTGYELGRIITVAHLGLLEANHSLQAWYDACIHFSDVCLINRSPETTNHFIQDFIDHYEKQHFPCLFELVSKGGIKNPELILEPQARRISLYFEPDADQWLDEDDDDFEEPLEDPYMEKLPSGFRKKRIPDIETLFKSD